MKKFIKWTLILVPLLVIAGVAIVLFNLDGIVRRAVENGASDSLRVNTTLAGAKVSLTGGTVALTDMQISSPEGYVAPKIFTMGGIDLAVKFSQLRGDPIRIESLTINKPTLVVEHKDGKFNIKSLMDLQSSSGETMKVIVNRLVVKETTVILRPGIPGMENEIPIVLPTVELVNIGTGEGNQNGVALKQLTMTVITTLAAKAAESDRFPPQLQSLLKMDVDAISKQIGGHLQKEIEKALKDVTGKLPAELGGLLENKSGDIGKAAEKGLQDLLGGRKKDEPTTRPNR